MNFYSTWGDTLDLGIDDTAFITAYIDELPITQVVWDHGNSDEVEQAVQTLCRIPAIRFVEAISACDSVDEIIAAEVPCFSTFTNGIIRVNELLEFAEAGLTYAEIGYQLVNTPNLMAQIKYGENHSKLAAKMSLVSIANPHRHALVTSTALGHYLVAVPIEEKEDILRKLLLRDHCIKVIVKQAMMGQANYRSIVKKLSDSTAYRRRTSVKCAVEFALGSPDTKHLLSNIVWDI